MGWYSTASSCESGGTGGVSATHLIKLAEKEKEERERKKEAKKKNKSKSKSNE